jgi:hypothetical protein
MSLLSLTTATPSASPGGDGKLSSVLPEAGAALLGSQSAPSKSSTVVRRRYSAERDSELYYGV